MRYNLDLFAEKDTELGKTQTVKVKIDTGDHMSIKLKPYRTPFTKKPIVDKTINRYVSS